jgi:hypothetical protein
MRLQLNRWRQGAISLPPIFLCGEMGGLASWWGECGDSASLLGGRGIRGWVDEQVKRIHSVAEPHWDTGCIALGR